MLLLFYWYILVFYWNCIILLLCRKNNLVRPLCSLTLHMYHCLVDYIMCRKNESDHCANVFLECGSYSRTIIWIIFWAIIYIWTIYMNNNVLVVNKMLFCYFGCNIRCFGVWLKIKEDSRKDQLNDILVYPGMEIYWYFNLVRDRISYRI